jgi:hypothetical protein
MKRKMFLALCAWLLLATSLFPQAPPVTPPRGDRPFLNSINGQIYFSDMFPGATTVAHIQYIINSTVGPVWIVVPPAETGTAGDFAGVVLPRTNVAVIDLREGVLNYGVKNPGANTLLSYLNTSGNQTFTGTGSGVCTASATLWMLPLGEVSALTCTITVAGQADNRGVWVASAGTIKNLYVQSVGVAKAGGPGCPVTVYNGAAAQTLTCTIPAGGTTCSNTVNTFAVAAGDIIGVQVGATQAADTLSDVRVTIEKW